MTHPDFPALFTARAADSHKGSFGTVGVIGGGPGMTGAALLAGRAALRLGAGKVLVGFVESPAPLACDPMQPELMCREALSVIDGDYGVTTWVAGCGAGTQAYAIEALSRLLETRGDTPLVLDADALNLLAEKRITASWGDALTVLTPHPAEASRLLGCSTADIQADRPRSGQALARAYNAWIILKGAATIICSPQGACHVNASGNPGLATAGTGDVLAGMLGSLLAQGLTPEPATRGGVWLHGAAADECVKSGLGPIGLTAGELAEKARWIRNNGQKSNE